LLEVVIPGGDIGQGTNDVVGGKERRGCSLRENWSEEKVFVQVVLKKSGGCQTTKERTLPKDERMEGVVAK